MSVLSNSLRSYWAPGLNEISGNVAKGVASWLSEEHYQIYAPLRAKHFILQVSDPRPYLSALAADVNRTAAAAFESISQAARSDLFPRSTAWIVIKSYYAAFFAAHAILRMIGKGFFSIEQAQAASLNKIAKAYGTWQEDVAAGDFVSMFSAGRSDIVWRRVDSSGGVHDKFWAFFKSRVDELSKEVLSSRTGVTSENQQVSIKLAELVENLCYDGCQRGTWLSVVRNRVNYKHKYGAWYPYTAQHPSGAVDLRLTRGWQTDPMAINFSLWGSRDLFRFQEVCRFLVGWCHVLASDMASRCSTGRSFHTYGWLAISRFAQQRSA